jgi:hypothetical protein
MREYNLSLSDVELKNSEIVEAILEEGSRIRNWRKFLLQSVATLNFCQLVVVVETQQHRGRASTSRSTLKILGKDHNVVSARHMADYLVEALERLAREQAAAGRGALESFKTGIADRLCARLSAMAREDEIPDSPVYGLVKNERAALQEHLAQLNVRKASYRRTVADGDAYHSGLAAAEGISLNAQLRGKFSGNKALTHNSGAER